MADSGYVRLPAPAIDLCPKCGSANHWRAVNLWRIVDERGLHWECDVCGYSWALAGVK